MPCCAREEIGIQFDAGTAAGDLKRFRRRGSIRSTRFLIDDLLTAGVAGASLLDIGGGIGAIHHALLEAGAEQATHVDLSPDYIAAAREEAERRGHSDRVRFALGDFITVVADLPDADVVTLDRVICCYPDMDLLVGRAADKALKILGAVYPRDVWWVRLGVGLGNLIRRLRRTSFRVFVYRPASIDNVLRRHGFERRSCRRTLLWEVVTYRNLEARAV
jgi:magnesium-protoporphyrin O-methyltransferase